MGKVIEIIDTRDFEESLAKVEKYMANEAHQAEKLSDSTSFQLVWLAKKYDDWFLDPIVGFVLPGVGDFLSSAAILPALYIALFRIRSIKLAFAIFYIGILDLIVGAIPMAGDIIDAFYKANKKAARWLVGYIDNDPNVKDEVNKAAGWGVFVLLLIGLLTYLCYEIIVGIFHWIQGLF